MPDNCKTTKRCKTCHLVKSLSDYYKKIDNKDDRETQCKKCKNSERMRRYYRNHTYYCARAKELREIDILATRASSRKRVAKHRAKFGGLGKWALENPDKHKASLKKHHAKWQKKPKNKLRTHMSNLISRSIKGEKKCRSWQFLVGYTLEELKKHIEKQFQPNMTWENYGKWHIDHKIPVAVFNFDKPEHPDFRLCWALKNLQPLWAEDNIKKGAKIEKPFQPSLKLEGIV